MFSLSVSVTADKEHVTFGHGSKTENEIFAVDVDDPEMRLVNLLPICLLYTSPSPRDATLSRMPSSA